MAKNQLLCETALPAVQESFQWWPQSRSILCQVQDRGNLQHALGEFGFKSSRTLCSLTKVAKSVPIGSFFYPGHTTWPKVCWHLSIWWVWLFQLHPLLTSRCLQWSIQPCSLLKTEWFTLRFVWKKLRPEQHWALFGCTETSTVSQTSVKHLLERLPRRVGAWTHQKGVNAHGFESKCSTSTWMRCSGVYILLTI